MNVLIDSGIPYIKGVLEPYAAVEYLLGSDFSADRVKHCQALIIRTRTRCNRELLEGSDVRFIATATIGHDHIDMDYCRSKGITVFVASGCNADAVVQYVLAAVLEADKREPILPKETVLGVVGAGNVGSRVVALFEAMGFKVLVSDPYIAQRDASFIDTPLDYLLENSHIVTLHVPLTFDGLYPTASLIHSGNIGLLKTNNRLFVNTSRGGVVDEQALIRAVEEGVVEKCVTDVWCGEPKINPQLAETSFLATPHIAGYSKHGKANGTAFAVRAFAREFGIPDLQEWFPAEVAQKASVSDISFANLKRLMPLYYDIAADSRRLKSDLGVFEQLRDRYDYRTEFF